MEQILYAENWGIHLRFPGKKIGVVIILTACLCFLGVNARNDTVYREAYSSGNEPIAGKESSMAYEEKETDAFGKELLTQIKRNTVGLDLADPVNETISDTAANPEMTWTGAESSGNSMPSVPVSSSELTGDTESVGKTDTVPVPIQVCFYGNGGVPAETMISYEDLSVIGSDAPIPQRPGKVFDGWYLDEACTLPLNGTISESNNISVYAGWKDLENFRCDEQGIITACVGAGAVRDGLLLLPSETCCTGIGAGAFSGMEEQITDIYIPANITEIDAAAFADLYNLMYIEVEPGNPCYYSQGGILYRTGGEAIAYPVWYLQED